MIFEGWDKFKEIPEGSVVRDREGYEYKIRRTKNNNISLEMIKSPDPTHRITNLEKNTFIYWSTWTILQN